MCSDHVPIVNFIQSQRLIHQTSPRLGDYLPRTQALYFFMRAKGSQQSQGIKGRLNENRVERGMRTKLGSTSAQSLMVGKHCPEIESQGQCHL